MRLAKLFFASIVFIFGSLFFVPGVSSAQSFQNPLLLVPFDFDYYDHSKNNLYSSWFTSSAPADIDLSIKKFGKASAHFPATGLDREMLYKSPNLDLSSQDFTIDFWWYPVGQDFTNFKKILLSFWDLDANSNLKSLKWYFYYYESGFWVVDYDKNITLRNFDSAGLLNINQWNHISIQWKQGTGGTDGGSGLGISINGKMRPSNSFYNNGIIPSGVGAMVVGYDSAYWPRVDYYLDEFRITKGTALWGNVTNQNGSFTPPTQPTPVDYSNPLVDQNKVTTPAPETIGTHVVSLGNTTDSTESNVAYSACPPGSTRPSTREEYLIKLDGTPKLTSYFDINNKIICTVYWAGNATTTTSKKLRRFEYDTDGQIAREMYYGVDGASVTDVVTYFSKSVGGARQKEIQNRNGTEYYKRYSTTGRLLYEHEYKNGQYVVSRNFTYDGAGRLASELVFSSPGKYEKIVYTRNGSGVVTQTDSYRAYTPADASGANYVHTTSTYTGTVVTGITRTYFNKDAGSPTALRTEIARYNTSGVAIDQRTFDYAQNKQKFSTYITSGTGSLLGRLKTDEEWSSVDYSYASSSLAYNTSGELISWSKVEYDDMSAQGAKAGYYWTKYTIYNVKTGLPKEENFYDRWPSLYTKRQTVVTYDDKGAVSYRRTYDYRDTTDACASYSSVCAHTVTKYTKDGFVQTVTKYNDTTAIANYEEHYYGNGEVWYVKKYQYNTPSANQYTANSFRVNYRNNLSTSTASDLVADGTRVYTKDFALVSEPSPTDPLGQKKIGDNILANISDASLRGQAQGGVEKNAIRAVLKALLPEYKSALLAVSESDPLKKEKRYEIYVAYSWRITRAIYAIEYRFHSGSPKYLNTDKALDSAVTGWYGVDGGDLSGNTEFWGLYIRPGAVNYADTEAVYVDMSITNPSSVDFAVNISSYDDLKGTPKKIEKWDALRSDAGFSYANNTLSLFNLSGGVGRYITLDVMSTSSPVINLTLDRFEEDMRSSGVVLSTLTETQLIEKMYQYFDKQSYFSYLYDLSQVAQTVDQTLVRKGGDCEDFGLFFLSLLRGEFTRLGNTDAVSRLGLVTARVDENNPVTTQNIGGGHATVGFRQGSQYYYIEGSFLFLGSGADTTRPTPRALNPLSASGSTVAGTIGRGGWYVQASDMYPLLGSRVPFSGSLGVFHDTISQTNSLDTTVAQVSNIYTKLEPYNPLVTTLASSTVQTIPNFKNQSVEFVVESTHSFFSRLAQYVPESGTADVWRGIDQIIPAVINPDGTVNLSAKISGDCEDLAFAEASLLENVLLRYYLSGGAVPENAVNQAKKNVIIVAEKDYGGVAGRSHLYVGFLTPKTDTSPAVVRLIDPQSGTIGAPQLMSDLYNDKYLFFSDREKVSAITPYDWSSLNFSAAVAAAAANGIVLQPGPVDPKAPVKQNLTPTQQAAIINAVVTADPPKPSAIKQFLNFVYEKSGAKAIVQSSTVLEAIVRVAVKAALLIGGGPIGTAVQFAASAVNAAIVGNITDKGPIPTAEDAGVKVVNGVVTVLGALTKPGGADSPERADAEAALRAGRTVPATPANMDSNNSSATEAAATTRQSGQVIVQRNSNTSVVNAIGPNDTSRTTTTKVYNSATNVMVITTNTVIVIPQSPITFFRTPPPPTCPAGTLDCTGSEGVAIPANARADGTPSSCYVSGVPSCATRQYDTAWVCEPFYDKDLAGTGCTCVDPLATSVGPTGECQYGATISCVGTLPPNPLPEHPTSVVRGVASYSPPAGQPSSTVNWNYDPTASQNNTQCKWSCASGYTVNDSFTQCVPNQTLSCVDIPPTLQDKAQMCPVYPPGPTGSTNLTRTISTGCTNVVGGVQRCEYICAYGHTKIGGSCVCESGQYSGGICVNNNTVSSTVRLLAVPVVANSAPSPSAEIVVKKSQQFSLSWATQSTASSLPSGSCSSGATKVGSTGWVEPYQNKWASEEPTLPINGDSNQLGLNLRLNESGTYQYTAFCRYGSGASSHSSQSTVTIKVEPSGTFEEF